MFNHFLIWFRGIRVAGYSGNGDDGVVFCTIAFGLYDDDAVNNDIVDYIVVNDVHVVNVVNAKKVQVKQTTLLLHE